MIPDAAGNQLTSNYWTIIIYVQETKTSYRIIQKINNGGTTWTVRAVSRVHGRPPRYLSGKTHNSFEPTLFDGYDK